MKRLLIIFSSSIILISCSTDRCVESYLKTELLSNRQNDIIPVLTDKKLKISNTLNSYIGRKKGNWNTQAKSFNQNDYDVLLRKYKNDTITEYWGKKESRKFGFISLIENGKLSKYRDSINLAGIKSEVYNYNLSKPVIIKDKKLALFSVVVTKQPNTILDDCTVIMKKENEEWILLEKVDNTSLH